MRVESWLVPFSLDRLQLFPDCVRPQTQSPALNAAVRQLVSHFAQVCELVIEAQNSDKQVSMLGVHHVPPSSRPLPSLVACGVRGTLAPGLGGFAHGFADSACKASRLASSAIWHEATSKGFCIIVKPLRSSAKVSAAVSNAARNRSISSAPSA